MIESFDIVVAGGTPAGCAAAVRAARGGCRVLLTHHTRHLGGMCANGLGQWDAKSDHRRCPFFSDGSVSGRMFRTLGRGTGLYRAGGRHAASDGMAWAVSGGRHGPGGSD